MESFFLGRLSLYAVPCIGRPRGYTLREALINMSDHVVSAVSTGGAGTVLEHRYAASCVALLLCRGELPFYPGSQIDEVNLQAGSLFWKTDDVVVSGTLPSGMRFTVASQVKRTCAPIESDENFVDFIMKAWADFNSPDRFAQGSVRLVLVAGILNAGLLRFRQLIEQAKANPTAAAWAGKLRIPAFLSKTVVTVKETIEALLAKAGEPAPNEEQIWNFLRHCGIGFTDLDAEGSMQEAQIVSLLRTTCNEADPVAGAANTWNELNVLTAVAEGVGKTFRMNDLPEHLRQRHARSRAVDIELLAELRRNREMVLAGCHDEIQGVALERTGLEVEISEALATHRVILITGPAGSGKSGIAKRVFLQASQDAFGLAFRVEEFAAANLRASPAMHGADFRKLLELSALFSKRVVLVESLERLLEDSRRDALLDFLRQLASDPTWHIVLTCRSSASMTVEYAFVAQAGLKAHVCEVNALSDIEQDFFAARIPKLARPLSEPRLRQLLRQLFFLEKAAAMAWPEAESLPTSEREFRRKVWSEIIRKDAVTIGGLPQRRAVTFTQIALNRAKELSPFVRSTGLDAEAIQKLQDDSLIVHAQDSAALVAPAHDVLEDWALLQWLDDEFQLMERKLLPLLKGMELFPALRRAYRKWLFEQIEASPAAAGPNIITVMRASELPQQWRDETIAALLRSTHASEFIRENTSALIAGKGELLFRCLHLCRVAATGRSKTMPIALGRLSIARVPDGAGWAALGELVSLNLGLVSTNEQLVLVAHFVSDWSRAVTPTDPYPAGAKYFARIALGLLSGAEKSYRVDEITSLLAVVAVKMPLVENEELTRQIRADLATSRFSRYGKGLAELAIDFTQGSALCRDMPDLVVECVNAYLYPGGMDHDEGLGRRRDVAEYFGLRPHLELEHASASALHGPFFGLLFAHPKKGLDLIISVINRAAQSYADSTAQGDDTIEPPDNVEIELPNGIRKTVFSGWRLWGMYRGASVSSYPLQSALMALERWLLAKAEKPDSDIASILQQIVGQTNNSALLAVVASIAVAHPGIAGTAAYTVLTVPSFFHLDLARMTSESVALEDMLGRFTARSDIDRQLSQVERRDSRKLPHRRITTEDLCRHLQTTPLRERVWGLLDRFRVEAGGENPKDTNAAVWLNIVHRMDLRQFQFVDRKDGYDHFSPKPLPLKVDEKLAPERPAMEAFQNAMELLNWGMAAFKGGQKAEESARWRDMLKRTETVRLDRKADDTFGPSGAAYIVAVAIRDHWAELTAEERQHCSRRIAFEIMKDAWAGNEFLSSQNHETNGDRPAAYVAPILLSHHPDDPDFKKLVAVALTHSVDQVRAYAAAGFRNTFEKNAPEKLLHVLGAYAEGTRFYGKLEKAEKEKDWSDRRPHTEIVADALIHTAMLIEGTAPLALDPLEGLRYNIEGAHLFVSIVAQWLSGLSSMPQAERFFIANAAVLVARWTTDDDSKGGDIEQIFETALARYAFSLPIQKAVDLLDSVARAAPFSSQEVGMFFSDVILQAEVQGKIEEFWALWELFAGVAQVLPVKELIDGRGRHNRLISKLFIVIEGGDDLEDWPLMQGREGTITRFYNALPAAAEITSFYLRYLEHFGAKALPAAFVVIAKRLAENATQLTANNVFTLEQLLSPRVFGSPLGLKSDPDVRSAVIEILDALVNAGSAIAYIMRDDFSTPPRQSV